jgi:hypothetical protein
MGSEDFDNYEDYGFDPDYFLPSDPDDGADVDEMYYDSYDAPLFDSDEEDFDAPYEK